MKKNKYKDWQLKIDKEFLVVGMVFGVVIFLQLITIMIVLFN